MDENVGRVLHGAYEFQREISKMKLLDPLPLLSNERRAKLALADEEEAEVTRLLLRAHELKKSVLLKRGSYAAIRILPPEILGDIFVLALPQWHRFDGTILPPFSVLEVNKWWRWIALNTSKLWACISLLSHSRYTERSITNLAIWLERARNSKLEVHMYGVMGLDGSDSIRERMWVMICRHLNHCSKLKQHSLIPTVNKHMVMLFNNGDGCSDLCFLELSAGSGHSNAKPPPRAPLLPSLRCLSLLGSFAKWDVQFRVPRLEKLLLGNINIGCRSLCDILNRYPVTLKLELKNVDISADDERKIQPCQLELQELTLAHFTSTKRFWTCIMPALRILRTLVIQETHYTTYEAMPVLPSVKHLVFDMNYAERLYRYHQYRAFLSLTPHITEVTIDSRGTEFEGARDYPNFRYCDPIIRELFVNMQDMQPVVCPQLRHVGIYLAKSSQKRILRLSRSRTALLLKLADSAQTCGKGLMQPFTRTAQHCIALRDMYHLALPELEEMCKRFPQEKMLRHILEDPLPECVEDCDCDCSDSDCDCCDHRYPASDSDDDP